MDMNQSGARKGSERSLSYDKKPNKREDRWSPQPVNQADISDEERPQLTGSSLRQETDDEMTYGGKKLDLKETDDENDDGHESSDDDRNERNENDRSENDENEMQRNENENENNSENDMNANKDNEDDKNEDNQQVASEQDESDRSDHEQQSNGKNGDDSDNDEERGEFKCNDPDKAMEKTHSGSIIPNIPDDRSLKPRRKVAKRKKSRKNSDDIDKPDRREQENRLSLEENMNNNRVSSANSNSKANSLIDDIDVDTDYNNYNDYDIDIENGDNNNHDDDNDNHNVVLPSSEESRDATKLFMNKYNDGLHYLLDDNKTDDQFDDTVNRSLVMLGAKLNYIDKFIQTIFDNQVEYFESVYKSQKAM